MKIPTQLPSVPASYFSVVLGLAGLGSAWRRAHQVWNFSFLVGELLLAFAGIVWACLLICYGAKWLWSRDAALHEAKDPVQCCFIGLVGVATMLTAGAALPYSRSIALALMLPGCIFTFAFSIWRTGMLWCGDRDDTATTAVLYLPPVAGGFVSANLLAALGWQQWGQLAFGAATLSWLAIESVLLRRLYIGPSLPPELRPTLGIQLAPPAVGLIAYLSINADGPGLISHALLGYSLFQALVLLGRMNWLTQQEFAPSYWAFSFGVTALGQAPLIMLSNGESDPAVVLAPLLFGAANLIVGLLFIKTVRWIFINRQ